MLHAVSKRTYMELKQDRELILAQGVCLYYGDAMKNQQTFFFGLLKKIPNLEITAVRNGIMRQHAFFGIFRNNQLISTLPL